MSSCLSGTWGEYIVVDKKDVVPCPHHLSIAEASALPLAGLTAYRYGGQDRSWLNKQNTQNVTAEFITQSYVHKRRS
jgi:NADPH:quinone reductase-like Zn-dependent oxidoreductase